MCVHVNEDMGVRERESPSPEAQDSQVTPPSLAGLCLPLETPGVPGSGRFSAPGRGAAEAAQDGASAPSSGQCPPPHPQRADGDFPAPRDPRRQLLTAHPPRVGQEEPALRLPGVPQGQRPRGALVTHPSLHLGLSACCWARHIQSSPLLPTTGCPHLKDPHQVASPSKVPLRPQ